jgi:hypothetical protein
MVSPFFTTTNDATPMQSGLAVTPGASALAPPSGPARPTRGVLVGGTGTLVCTFADGSTATITVPATACGFVIPLAVTVIAGGSTATSIVAFF